MLSSWLKDDSIKKGMPHSSIPFLIMNDASSQDADDSAESIATILGIDLSKTIIPGDLDKNGTVELSDAILSFQVSAGIGQISTFHHEADVNRDNRIGIEESIYILQKVSGIR